MGILSFLNFNCISIYTIISPAVGNTPND